VRPRLALLIALALVAGCSSRQRTNPFDPRNPQTSGRPIGFAAIAGDQRVALQWQAVTAPDLRGYVVFRQAPGEADFHQISSLLSASTSTYVDYGLTNGATFAYRLYYQFSTGLGGRPADDAATPGPVRTWVVDAGTGSLHRIAPDARRVAFTRGGFDEPTAVAVDSTNGVVWIADAFAGRVTVLDPFSGVTTMIPGLGTPAATAIDTVGHTAWVCDEGQDLVYHFAQDGGEPTIPISAVRLPIGVAIDAADRSVIICDRDNNLVRRHDPGGNTIWTRAVTSPSRCAVDAATGDIWVTSFEGKQVTKLTRGGAPVGTFAGFAGPIGLVVDEIRGRVWVADALGDQLVALHRDGSVEFRVPGMNGARDVSIDRPTGEAWAALTASGEVARVSAAGVVLRILGGFNEPSGIVVDPGTRY